MFGIGLPELAVIFLLALIVKTIVTLVDIVKSEFTGNNKIIWFLVVFFVPLFGVIAYAYIGKSNKMTLKQFTPAEKKGAPMSRLGILLLIAGILALIISYNMKTTITTDSQSFGYGINIPSMTVNNIGLMEERRNALLGSGLVVLIGVILVIAGNIQYNQTVSSGTVEVCSQKKCPYCAEIINTEAVICRFCNRELQIITPPMTNNTSNIKIFQNNSIDKITQKCIGCDTPIPYGATSCPMCGASAKLA